MLDPIFVETEVPTEVTDQCIDWPDAMPDSRWGALTLDNLIRHKMGLDRDQTPSRRWTDKEEEEFYLKPMGWCTDQSYNADSKGPFAKGAMMIQDMELALPGNHVIDGPVLPDKLIQYLAGHCFHLDPGTKYHDSNVGYVLLGRVLEGLNGVTFTPELVGTAARPVGFGPYADLLRQFLVDNNITPDVYGGSSDPMTTQYGKDTAQDQYGKITDFLKRAACTIDDWPGPIPLCPDPPCLQWK